MSTTQGHHLALGESRIAQLDAVHIERLGFKVVVDEQSGHSTRSKAVAAVQKPGVQHHPAFHPVNVEADLTGRGIHHQPEAVPDIRRHGAISKSALAAELVAVGDENLRIGINRSVCF